jgi:hypothetical protein
MLVQFSGSERNLKEDMVYYREITKCVKDLGHELVIDWIEDAYTSQNEIKKAKTKDKREWKVIHAKSIDALKRADVCIYEATERSFSIGFQTALVLQMKKPVLVLLRNDSMRSSFGEGIVSDLLTYKTYTPDDLKSIVATFLKDHAFSVNDLRFNFVIDKDIDNYLRWMSFNSNTTKADIIRKILRQKIAESNGEIGLAA